MFLCEFDTAFALGVMLFEVPPDEEDFARYIEAIPTMDQRAKGRESPVLVVEFGAGYPAPKAAWRKRLVEARDHIVSKPLVALVAPSVAMRAGISLVRWLDPPPFEQQVFSTFEEAMEWVAQKRGPTTKVLARLYEDVTRKAGRTPGAKQAR